MSFSVIIPVLNEEATIGRCLSALTLDGAEVEVIVVDGGSEDTTVVTAQAHDVRVISGLCGRGTQLNAGGRVSSGDILVFLHADTRVPPRFFDFLAEQFRDPGLQCGAFRAVYDDSSPVLRVYSWFTRFETRFSTFGDQCLVVRRSFFVQLGGFPDWPLFEDMEFLRKARRETEIRKFPVSIVTSARKFRTGGPVLQQLRNVATITLFSLGVSPGRLYRMYYGRSTADSRDSSVRKHITPLTKAADVKEGF